MDVAAAGLTALNPETLLRKVVHLNESELLEIVGHFFPTTSGRIFVIGGGKAADVMAAALESILTPKSITAGIVICKTQSARPRKIQVREAGHPIPDQRGLDAMNEIMAMKDKYDIDKNDLVICLLSGGASALMPLPAPGITLEDKQALTRMLLASGAEISEVNVIRKHLSSSKGGKLGLHFASAMVISLIVSDVIGNDLAAIGSGPTFPEKTTPQAAVKLIQHYGLWDKIPESIQQHLKSNSDQPVMNEPENCFNYIIGDSNTALEAMKHEVEQKGKRVLMISNALKGEPESTARELAGNILDGKYGGYDVLLAAGETTPALPNNPGQGGRNQHFAASTLLCLKDLSRDWVHISLGSDGSDYLSDVAGALVDSNVLEKSRTLGLSLRDYLDRFDTYNFFKKIGSSLIETGPTGTNVGDLMIYVI